MKRSCYPLAATLAVLLTGLAAPARAQGVPFGGPTYNPPVNPILNLNRQGSLPGINYFNLVQPQIQFGSSINQLQQQAGQLQSEITGAGNAAGLVTGHPVAFGNLSHYYAFRGLAGVSGGGLVGGFGFGQGGLQGGFSGGGGGGFNRPGQVGGQGGASQTGGYR
jgi:hypothetical protein